MKLALGTVQLGLSYGVANQSGKPARQEAFNIIDYAVKRGVDVLDTAAAYGESEEIIGAYFSKNPPRHKVRIITKIPGIDAGTNEKWVVPATIQKSLADLQLTRLDGCLLHDPKNIDSHGGAVMRELMALKKQGTVEKIGVSVNKPSEVERFLELDGLDIIQVPLNVFDQRLTQSGLLGKLSQKGVEIHTRSALLQGLLVMDPDQLPANLTFARQPLLDFQKLAASVHLTPAELALLFVRDLPEVDKLVIGCETVRQLQENVRIYQLPPLKKEIIELVKTTFAHMPEQIITPSRWGNIEHG
ncbi:aldo/keto reductase [Halobacillus salinarum]|uniref:Aldo/keto reductase n=1 Tax=Halobacillus salinarum TaxID=2932257 RepID=A0ABY4EK61_9BACI|nr:aldo/keto reductase [Halobacillus salinarum]UOQ44858.1 aldo/keto reductase [Halobacillus salinarum]